MEELYLRFTALLNENKQLKHENLDLIYRNKELEEKLTLLTRPSNPELETSFLIERHEKLIEENLKLKAQIFPTNKENILPKKIPFSERTDLTIHQSELNTKLEIANEKISFLKIENSDLKNKIDKVNKEFDFIRRITVGLLGYRIRVLDNTVTLLSTYAFDEEDTFVLHMIDKNCSLMENSFAKSWEAEISDFVIKGGSWPAFFSHVTTCLYNQKTFG